MGGAWSNALAWVQKGKDPKIVVLTMSHSTEDRLPVDPDQLQSAIEETVASSCNIVILGEVWDFNGRCGERPRRVHHLSGADGVIFMLDEEKVSKRELVKEDEEKLSETEVAKEDEERVSLRIIANEYISNHLKGDFPRFSKVPPILFVRFKKYPEGPDERISDRDEGDDFAADIGLNEITKISWNIVVCDVEKIESLSEGLRWLRDRIDHPKLDGKALTKVLKSGEKVLTGNHGATVLQKIKHLICRSPTPA